MPVYFVISSIIILIGVFRLYKLKIICYEKMRLIFAADINTVFMSKINILSDDKYEIEGYHPVCQSSKVSNLFIQTFYEEAFDPNYIYTSYFNEKNNKKRAFSAFPGPVNNYEITSFTLNEKWYVFIYNN